MNLKSNESATTKNLLSHSFNIMKLLNAKAIDVDEAKAQANLLKQANNLYKLELDTAIAKEKYPELKIKDIS